MRTKYRKPVNRNVLHLIVLIYEPFDYIIQSQSINTVNLKLLRHLIREHENIPGSIPVA